MNHFAEWSFAIRCMRLLLVAAHRDYWTSPVELYAFEAGPLFNLVSGDQRQ